jgi:hypothetical protein
MTPRYATQWNEIAQERFGEEATKNGVYFLRVEVTAKAMKIPSQKSGCGVLRRFGHGPKFEARRAANYTAGIRHSAVE